MEERCNSRLGGQGQGWGSFFFQPKKKKDKTAFQKKINNQ